MLYKACSKCKNEYDIGMFYKDRTNPKGLSNQCKICKNSATKILRLKRSQEEKVIPDQKLCICCNTVKETATCFTKYASTKDGLAIYCKECRRQNIKRQKEARQNVVDLPIVEPKLCVICKCLKSHQDFKMNLKCCDKISNICNGCRPKSTWNIEKQRASQKKYREANPDKLKEKYKRQSLNPTRRLRDRLNKRITQALITEGVTKNNTTVKYIGCSIQYLKKWIEHQFVDGMSWDNMGKWHMDHVKPCASFDLTNEVDILDCFNWKNLQPLWGKDNLVKSNKIDMCMIEQHLQKALRFEASDTLSAQAKEGDLLETPESP